MSFYIIEWNDGSRCLATSLKRARAVAREETGLNETVRILRVVEVAPVPISPSKEMNQSDTSLVSERSW